MPLRLIACLLALIPVVVIGLGLYARFIYNVCLALDFAESTSSLLATLTILGTIGLPWWTAAYRMIEGHWWWQVATRRRF
jgi:hypothetical protein